MEELSVMQSVMLKMSDIQPNRGQIKGLSKNPRLIKDDKYRKLVASIEEHPEFTAMRELLVYPFDGKYVIIGGNMRYKAMKELGIKSVPCKVIPEETSVEQLQAYTLKDNSGFGEWDFDLLKDWDLQLIESVCIDLPKWEGTDVSPDEFGEEFSLKDGDKDPFQRITFILADEQADAIKTAIEKVKRTDEYKYIESYGNENTNGNAIYTIVKLWENARK